MMRGKISGLIMNSRFGITVAIVFSLLCPITVAVWVRSYRVRDAVVWSDASGNTCQFQSLMGRAHFRFDADAAGVRDMTYATCGVTDWDGWFGGRAFNRHPTSGKFGFVRELCTDWRGGLMAPPPKYYELIVVPYAGFAAFFAFLPLLCLVPWSWRRKAKPGYCAQCGYDLRATKDRCPECGLSVTVPDRLPMPPAADLSLKAIGKLMLERVIVADLLVALFVLTAGNWLFNVAGPTLDQLVRPAVVLLVLMGSCRLPMRQAFVLVRGRRRLKRGRCLACGADLRSATHCCPACGAGISHAVRAPAALAPVRARGLP